MERKRDIKIILLRMRAMLFFLLCFMLNVALAQTSTSSNAKALKKYKEAGTLLSVQNFSSALQLLQEASLIDPSFAAAFQQIGDIERKQKNYSLAEKAYRRVLELNPGLTILTIYGLAESLFYQAKYEEALPLFRKYKEHPNLRRTSIVLCDKYIDDCLFSIAALKRSSTIHFTNLGSAINTADDEYLPSMSMDGNHLLFTRRHSEEDFYLSAKDTDGNWSKAIAVKWPMATSGNEGAASISPDGQFLYFAGCDKPGGLGRCDIYMCIKEKEGWGEPINLGYPVNTAAWESQPSIGSDGRTLYFVSNRNGGIGSYDIWMTRRDDEGQWSEPVNLGPKINTPYDEHSPFIHPDNKTLYFSSNGWPGFGNRDIFVVHKNEHGMWSEPINLGAPINNENEQSSLFVEANGKFAYYASEMEGGNGKMDIYRFALPEEYAPLTVSYVKGIITDTRYNNLLNAKVQITDLSSGLVVYNQAVRGSFLAVVPSSLHFEIVVHKAGYLYYERQYKIATNRTDELKKAMEVGLTKIEKGVGLILENVFFETNRSDLDVRSFAALNTLYDFLRNNKEVCIEIGGHTDGRGTLTNNGLLSEARAKSVYDYLIKKGLSATQINYKGYGASQPIDTNETEQGRAKNRRTAFKVL